MIISSCVTAVSIAQGVVQPLAGGPAFAGVIPLAALGREPNAFVPSAYALVVVSSVSNGKE